MAKVVTIENLSLGGERILEDTGYKVFGIRLVTDNHMPPNRVDMRYLSRQEEELLRKNG